MSGRREEDRLSAAMGRIYRALLVAYPKGFRGEYGEEMQTVFEDQCREEREAGGAPRLARLGLRTASDLVATAARERGGAFGRGASAAVGRGLYGRPRRSGKANVVLGLFFLLASPTLLVSGDDFSLGLAWAVVGTVNVLGGTADLAYGSRRGLAALLRLVSVLCLVSSTLAFLALDYARDGFASALTGAGGLLALGGLLWGLVLLVRGGRLRRGVEGTLARLGDGDPSGR